MGWTVLYIAFGVVALWLLGEVLLQYKARLRWRLLAFVGFLGVVAGVAVPSVAVIVVGALAFGVGQTFVTLSFRRGFSMGWALRRKEEDAGPGSAPKGKDAPRGRGKGRAAAENRPGSGRRRKGPAPAPAPAATDTDGPSSGPDAPPPAPSLDAAATELMPAVPQQPTAEQPHPGGYDPSGSADDNVFGHTDGYDGQAAAPGAPAQGGYAGQYDYGQGQYASYSDPYIGNRPPSYEQYDVYGQQQPYPQQTYPQQQYGGGTPASGVYTPQYDFDTPPGGVWVPQQRDNDTPPSGQGGQQQPYPPQQAPGHGYDEQQHYRY
ncbi:hypothetical protein [Streptomyces griseocarneus]|uniref:hypothetical protein n=1 Tax=Streptomyces griseocarneus TaxID=51201 RepID=UPI00167CC894|nr:hypothetical protein [Streptomyces griseocarneus]MBZ6471999.1 hypothetical protein [Streptomyces griseocarneus]GHG71951.1 hypothetical protein GCM10018779_47240 [Streptomyces griseocarneus]